MVNNYCIEHPAAVCAADVGGGGEQIWRRVDEVN